MAFSNNLEEHHGNVSFIFGMVFRMFLRVMLEAHFPFLSLHVTHSFNMNWKSSKEEQLDARTWFGARSMLMKENGRHYVSYYRSGIYGETERLRKRIINQENQVVNCGRIENGN